MKLIELRKKDSVDAAYSVQLAAKCTACDTYSKACADAFLVRTAAFAAAEIDYQDAVNNIEKQNEC
jgi:hypothetical protein